MRWDQVVTWLIIPAVGAIILGIGGIWLSRHIPQRGEARESDGVERNAATG
jgi:hypothetical protein